MKKRFVFADDVGKVVEDVGHEGCLTSLLVSLGNIVLHVSGEPFLHVGLAQKCAMFRTCDSAVLLGFDSSG